MISQQTIQKVIETADIVEVIGEFVNLKRSGSNYKALCPFHKERTPSFVVSPAKQIFKCFGCGESGNVVSFLMKHEQMTFQEAIRYLAKKYNIPIEETDSDEAKQKQQERESLLIVNKFAQQFYTNILFNDDEGISVGLSYLRQRGFTDETIERFQLGYAPDKRSALTDHALQQGYSLETLAKAGLTIIKGEQYSDRFWARVMFPIHSMSGQILGFAGRTLRDDKSVAKYLNTPETEIFQKRRILYGMYFAKRHITRENKCYLVEGYTDVISFHQAGIENTVASLGTSLTEEQVNLIHRLTENLTLIFDGDNAGIKAAFRGIDIALKEGLNLRVVALPQGEDPDSFSKKLAPADLKEYIQTHEQDFISFKANFLIQEAGQDPVKRAQAISDIVQSISVVPDPVTRQVFVRQAAEILQIPEDTLYAEIKKIIANRLKRSIYRQPKEQKTTLTARTTPAIPAYVGTFDIPEEKNLIRYLMLYGNKPYDQRKLPDGSTVQRTVAEFLVTELQNEELEFKNTLYRKVFEYAKQLLLEGKPVEFKVFISHPDPEIQQLASEILSSEYELSKIWERRGALVHHPHEHYRQGLTQELISYKMRVIHLAMKELIEQMRKVPADNFELLDQLQSQYMELMSIRSTLNNMLGNKVILPSF